MLASQEIACVRFTCAVYRLDFPSFRLRAVFSSRSMRSGNASKVHRARGLFASFSSVISARRTNTRRCFLASCPNRLRGIAPCSIYIRNFYVCRSRISRTRFLPATRKRGAHINALSEAHVTRITRNANFSRIGKVVYFKRVHQMLVTIIWVDWFLKRVKL